MTIKRADERDTVTEIGSDVSSGYVGVVTCVGVVICVGVVTCVGVICGPGPEVLGQVMISDSLQNLYCLKYSAIMMRDPVSLSGRIEGEGVRGKGVSLEGVEITVGEGGMLTYFHSKYGSHPLRRVCVAQGEVAGVLVLHSLSVHSSRARCVGHLQPLAYHSQSHHIVC